MPRSSDFCSPEKKEAKEEIASDAMFTVLGFVSLQNRRNFLRISGEQKRKLGERVASAKRELRARGGSHATRASRLLAFASARQKYAKNYACSAGYGIFTSPFSVLSFSFD